MSRNAFAVRTTRSEGLESPTDRSGPILETRSPLELAEGVVLEIGPRSGQLAAGDSRVPTFEVQLGARSVEAKRAASCLLAPAEGDRVVVSVSASEAFVLAVLERPGASIATVELGHGVQLETDADKNVRLQAARALDLSAGHAVTVTSDEVHVRANRATFFSKKLEAVGVSIESSFDDVRQFARRVEVVADEVSSRLKRSLRFISDIDQTRARIVDTRAEGLVTIHGENTSVTERQIAKIDSKQIHIG